MVGVVVVVVVVGVVVVVVVVVSESPSPISRLDTSAGTASRTVEVVFALIA